jgi:GR25 family glycosyltransferase involved in LPS biosynthesis
MLKSYLKFYNQLIKFSQFVKIFFIRILSKSVNLYLAKDKTKICAIWENIPIFVINLEKRPDRLISVTRALRCMGIENFVRFNAKVDQYPKRGCAKSHLSLWEKSLNNSANIVMICEDDLEFVGNIRTLRKSLDDFINEKDIHVLCIANLTKDYPVKITRNLRRTQNVQTTACYLVKKEVLKDLIRCGEKSIAQLTSSNGVSGAIDKVWKDIQGERVFTIPRSILCIQSAGHSDIENRKVRYLY